MMLQKKASENLAKSDFFLDTKNIFVGAQSRDAFNLFDWH